MADRSSWWFNRAGDAAAATSSKTSPTPDFGVAMDIGQANLTPDAYNQVINYMMTEADDQDMAALQTRAAEMMAQGDVQGALRLLQDNPELAEKDDDSLWGRIKGAGSKVVGGVKSGIEKIAGGAQSGGVAGFGTPAIAQAGAERLTGTPAGDALASAGESVAEQQERGMEFVGDVADKAHDAYMFMDQVVATPFVAATLSDGGDWTDMFKANTWSEAWDLSGDNLSAGQAIADIWAGDADTVSGYYRAGFDEQGRPRDRAYAELRDNSTWYNLTSGTLDFAKAWFLDPLVIGGKTTKTTRAMWRGDLESLPRNMATRARNIATMTDEQVDRLFIPKWDFAGQRALKLRERMLTVRDEVRKGERDVTSLIQGEAAFADSPDAAALFEQASKAKKFDPTTGTLTDEFDDDMFRDFVGATLGHGPSQRRLAQRGAEGKELQTALDHMRQTRVRELEELANASARKVDELEADESLSGFSKYWRTMNAEKDWMAKQEAADSAREVLKGYESHLDFITKARTRAVDQLRIVPGGGQTLAGKGFDVATHVYRPAGSNGVTEAYTRYPIAALRRRPGVVDLHRPGQAHETLDRWFDQAVAYGKKGIADPAEFNQVRREYANRVARATTDAQRSQVLKEAEEYGFQTVARAHGLEPEAARAIAQAVQGRRESLFASLIEKHGPDAKELSFVEDGVKQTIELTATQLQQSYFMTDLRALDGVLAQHGHAIGETLRDSIAHFGDRASERATTILEQYNHLWKPMVLFRLGYPIRTVADDWARAFAVVDNMATLIGRSSQAALIGTANIVPRTGNMFRAPWKKMIQRQWDNRNADVLKGVDGSLADMEPVRLRAIEERLGDVDRYEWDSLHAQANGSKLKTRHKVVDKLDRLLRDNPEEFAIDIASGRKVKTTEGVYDFGLSRARIFDKQPTGVELARYARENADRLSHTDGVLTVQRTPDGWRASIGRKGPNSKPLAKMQQRSMARGVTVGQHEFGAPAEAGVAENYIPLNSSGPAWQSLARSHESNVAQMRAEMIQQGRSTTIRDGLKHAENWARTVNRLFVKDPVVRRVLEIGPDETARWLRNTSEGRQAAQRLHVGNPVSYTDRLSNQINALLPDEALRAKVINGEELVPDELNARMQTHPNQTPAAVDGPAVELATHKGHFGDKLNGWVDKIYHVLATVPTDTLVRQPFFRSNYQARLRGMVDTLEDGSIIDDATKQLMEKSAREWALKQTRRYMFSLADETDLVHTMRFLMPFMGAWQETMTKWMTILSERPEQIYRIWGQGWQNMDELWFLDMVDEQGRSKDDPEHGDLTNIRLPVPKWMKENVLGRLVGDDAAQYVHSVNLDKNGMNAILQGSPFWLPGGGPVMQFPAAMLLDDPTLKDQGAFESFMYKYLFPTGRPSMGEIAFPAGWMQQAFRFHQGMDDPQFRTLAARIHQLDVQRWEAEGRPQGMRPTESEAVHKAKSVQAMMVAGRFASPTSFQIEVGQPESEVPAQFFIDAARRIQAEEDDWNVALDRFLNEFGDDAYAWWVATSNNKTGVPATSAAHKMQKQFADVINDNPEVGLAIVGLDTQNGPFNYEIYAAQEAAGERTRLEPGEVQAKAEANMGWREWHKLQTSIDAQLAARGLNTITQRGAEDLLQIQRYTEMQLNEAYPGWQRDREEFDKGYSYEVIRGLQSVLDSGQGPDPNFRQDWRGIAEYLQLHNSVGAELDRRFLAGGSRDVTTQANADLKWIWDSNVGQLVQQNPLFADLYHRMLEKHELTMGSGGL